MCREDFTSGNSRCTHRVTRKVSPWWRNWWRRAPTPLNPLTSRARSTVRPILSPFVRSDVQREPLFPGKYTHDPINLSTAKQLTDVAIRCELSSIKWVITTLRTITSKHLRRITIHLSGTPDRREGCPITDEVETVNSGMRWSDLDRLLVQFSKSHSIRSQVLYPRTRFGTKEVKDWVGQMLQESSRRGVVDLVGVSCVSRLQPVRRIVDAIRDQNCDVQT